MALTLSDIAQHVGLSKQAVSQALNQTGRLRPETRIRVRDMARELGYRPNAAARATSAGRHSCLALLVSTNSMRSTLSAGLLDGVQLVTQERQLNLMLVKLPDEKLGDAQAMPRALEESASDGFLVDYTHGIPQSMIDLIRRHDIPAIWINSKQEADCVRPDDLEAAQQATGHLLELGHRRIAYADWNHGPDFPAPHYSVADRRRGYELAMRKAGLTPRLIVPQQGHSIRPPVRIAFAREVLSSVDRPTAFLCYGNAEAEPIMHTALCLGLTVPEDLSVSCFAESTIKWFGPHLTVWQTPSVEIGRQATLMLTKKIRRPEARLPELVLPFTFYAGGTSCAPPAAV